MRISKSLKKFIIYFGCAFFISLFASYVYLIVPKLYEDLDNRLRDSMFLLRGEISHSNNVVIVDIDDKSLSKIGQWPWSRDVISEMLQKLTDYKAAIIGFDMVFAEEDRSNPVKILEKYNITVDKFKEIPDYDEIFAITVASTPTILGFQFLFDDKEFVNTESPMVKASFIEKNRDFTKDDLVLNAKGTILNIPIIQENSYSSGFFNNVPDASGMIRSIPLIIRYDSWLYPSLALELLRAALGVDTLVVNYNELGIENISMGDKIIPTDIYGRVVINFRGAEGTFKYISASDVLFNDNIASLIKDKIVLIGTSAAGLKDLRAIAYDSVYPGVEVHANIIDNMIQEDFIYKPMWADAANIFHIFIVAFLTILILYKINILYLPLACIVLLFVDYYTLYYVLFTEGLSLNIILPLGTILLSFIILNLINYFFEIKQSKMIKGKFASKVSAKVMEDLLKNENQGILQGESREVTVFFSDIRGFTNISESMSSAKELIEYLNEYMDPMTEIVMKHEGTVDKFIGDAIMAYWNAPADVKNHAQKAVLASLEQLAYLEPLNKKLLSENKPLIEIGIGLNTGIAVVGEMGSSGRSDYTVIGDPINLGARLESLCKYYNSKLNVSNFVKEKLEGDFVYRFLDLVKVKGKKEPIEIWQIYAQGQAQGKQKEELELYHSAIQLYENSQFKEAKDIFEDINGWEEKTNLNVYDIYIDRCEHFIKTPPVNFDGVYEHTTKG